MQFVKFALSLKSTASRNFFVRLSCLNILQNGIGFREVKEIKIKELNEKLLLLFLPLMLILNSCASLDYIDKEEELYRKEDVDLTPNKICKQALKKQLFC
ncbi:hypothetical protein AGMMS50233_08080 [Endomicrobiia bacterium]|nr:hypothetical protein AGMMS50233_08080 [Endomicrobiia bacterium]